MSSTDLNTNFDNTSYDRDHSTDPTTPQGTPRGNKEWLEKRFERTNAIHKALKCLVEPGAVTELRAFEVQLSETYKAKTISGYYDYDRLYDLAQKADELTENAPGVYYVLNPIDPELLSHRCNRTEQNPRSATKDTDILRLVRLFVDIDPRRRSKSDGREIEGISATNAEKGHAYDTAVHIMDDLSAAGWPRPVFCDSGNGYYLIYKINLTTDRKGLVESCLKALDAKYSDSGAKIDPAVFNPARIAKIPYTLSRKGDPTPDRPHRQSSVVSVPEVWSCVPTERLEALAATHQHGSAGTHAPASPPPRRALRPDTAASTGKYDHVVENGKRAGKTSRMSVEDRCRAYLEKVDPSVSGQRGHDRLFHAAMVIADKFGIEDVDTAYELLSEFNEKEGGDPEDERQLRHKLADAFGKVEAQGGPSRDLLEGEDMPEIYSFATPVIPPVINKPNNPIDTPGPVVLADTRRKILVDNNLHVIRDDILNVIQDDPALYKRGEVLVKFTQLESDEATLRGGATLKNAKGTYALWPIDEASFACHLAALAYFYKEKVVKGKLVEEQCDPPATPLRAVLRNKTFEGVRRSKAWLNAPI